MILLFLWGMVISWLTVIGGAFFYIFQRGWEAILWGIGIGIFFSFLFIALFYLPLFRLLRYNHAYTLSKGQWIRRYLISYGGLAFSLCGVFFYNKDYGMGYVIVLLSIKVAVILALFLCAVVAIIKSQKMTRNVEIEEIDDE